MGYPDNLGKQTNKPYSFLDTISIQLINLLDIGREHSGRFEILRSFLDYMDYIRYLLRYSNLEYLGSPLQMETDQVFTPSSTGYGKVIKERDGIMAQ